MEENKLSRKQIIKMIFSVILPPILVIALFVVAIGMVIIPATEDALMEKKRDMIQAIVISATSIMERHAEMEQDGLVSREEAQNTALSEMRAMRYGVESRDYIWITDLEPTMVMHPFFSELEGTHLDNYADPEGKLLFIEAVEIAKNEGEGYISYIWPKQDGANESVEKLSYVRLFSPWSWVVGSGIYLDDVQAEIQAVTLQLLKISLLIGGIVSLILLFIIRSGWKKQKDIYQFQNELKFSRECYQALSHASSEMIFLIIDGLIAGVNKKACEMLGFHEEEIISRNFAEFVPDAGAISLLAKAVHEESPDPIEIVIQGKYESERVLLSVEHAIVNERPAIMYAGYSLNLKESPSTNFVSHTTINQNGFGILKIENSFNGKILSADNLASGLLKGLHNESIVGKTLKSVINEGDANRLFIQVQAANQAQNIILRHTLSNCNEGYLQANASILHDETSLEGILLLFITDVTEVQSVYRSSDAMLSECLAPENKICLKPNEMIISPDDENIRQAYVHDKIILRQSVKIGSTPENIIAAAFQSIHGIFEHAVKKAILEIGAPPCKYALLAYGSIGRHEPTLTADQDTAILFESTGNDVFCKEYFDKFGQIVTSICSNFGIPPCNAGNTAANSKWCKSGPEWKRQFSEWINFSQPEDLILVNIFFDFSLISGDEALVKNLRLHIFDEIKMKPSFLFNLAQDTLSFRSPLDILGHIRSDSNYGNYVNLKGTMLHFVNFSRIYALKHGIHETNTIKRLQILTKMGYIPSDTGQDTIEAWNVLLEMRLINQVSSLELNFQEENTIILEELSSYKEISLSKAMSQVNNLQKRIAAELGVRG
jgi:PAS domain-containing protein